MQVAWPLRHPGVDRPACVSASLFLLLQSFSLTLSFFPFLTPLSVFTVSFHMITCLHLQSPLPQIYHFLPQGERCSFSVQMWFYFLCGLRSDLWAVLPAELARDVLGQVLTDTLQLLVRRYARARASYKRHLQIRYFIMHITDNIYI